MTARAAVLSGRRVVLALYAVTVGVAAVAGYLIGLVLGGDLPAPAYLGVLELPATPAGLAVYGAATVATVLGAGLLLLVAVSRRYAEGDDGGSAGDGREGGTPGSDGDDPLARGGDGPDPAGDGSDPADDAGGHGNPSSDRGE